MATHSSILAWEILWTEELAAKLLLLSRFRHARLLATSWTAAYQAPRSMGLFQIRVLEWDAID